MKAYSNYYIVDKNEPEKIVIINDENPIGVTITIKDTSEETGGQKSFSLPRMAMIEALEYVLLKIKA